MAKKEIKILFTGGGTGGHLFPIIAIAREITRLLDRRDATLYYVGPNDKIGFLLMSQENLKTYGIVSGKLRRYFSFKNVADIAFNIPLGFLQSFFLLLFIRPQLVFSKGGSGSLVVTLCAGILRIPVFLHESDMSPGLSNRIAYGFAKKVFTSFAKTEYFDLTKTILVGNPIKKELMEGSYESAKEIFRLSFKKPVLLFWGGSQGAEPVNDVILNMLRKLLAHYEIIHVCGKKNYQEVEAQSEVMLAKDKDLEAYYHLYGFLDEVQLKHALKVASLIISRGGSGSIFEMAAVGKPCIIIPLPSAAHNHQSKNAYQYTKSGAAIIIEQENFNPNFFIAKLDYLFSHPEELQAMKNSALRFARPLAARTIAREILEYLRIQ